MNATRKVYYQCPQCYELYPGEEAALSCCPPAAEKEPRWVCSTCGEDWLLQMDADACCSLPLCPGCRHADGLHRWSRHPGPCLVCRCYPSRCRHCGFGAQMHAPGITPEHDYEPVGLPGADLRVVGGGA